MRIVADLRTLSAAFLLLGAAVGVKASSPHPHDFPLVIYYPGRALLTGGNPYDRATYLEQYPVSEPFAPYAPGLLLLDLPFASLPLATAEHLYVGFMVALTILLAATSLKYNGIPAIAPTAFVIAGIILLTRPGRMNYVLGNFTLQAVIATYVALRYAPTRPVVSALGLAVALIKPSFGLPLAALMVGMGAVRAVLLGAGFELVLSLPPSLILAYRSGGVGEFFADFWNSLAWYQVQKAYNDPLLSPSRIDATSLLSRLTGEPLSGWEQLVVGVILVGTGIWALRALSRASLSGSVGLTVGIAGCVIVLTGYHQPYDALVLTLPAVAATYRCLPPVLNRTLSRPVLLGIYAVLALNYLTSFRMLDRLGLTIRVGELDRAVESRDPLVVVLIVLNALVILTLYLIFLTGAHDAITGLPDAGRAGDAGELHSP